MIQNQVLVTGASFYGLCLTQVTVCLFSMSVKNISMNFICRWPTCALKGGHSKGNTGPSREEEAGEERFPDAKEGPPARE